MNRIEKPQYLIVVLATVQSEWLYNQILHFKKKKRNNCNKNAMKNGSFSNQ